MKTNRLYALVEIRESRDNNKVVKDRNIIGVFDTIHAADIAKQLAQNSFDIVGYVDREWDVVTTFVVTQLPCLNSFTVDLSPCVDD